MRRRRFLELAPSVCVAGLAGTSPTGAATQSSTPPGVAWRRTYDELAIATAVPAHDGGHVVVGRGDDYPGAGVPVTVAVVDETGSVRKRREIEPDIPKDARRARADLIRTDDGYAVASGSWFARLDRDLSVETTGFASEYKPNSTTLLVELSDGFAIAAELDLPNHVSTRVLGFDTEGTLKWTKKYGKQDSKWLGFLLDGPDGGLVVGGPDPWMASLAANGTERWQTKMVDVPSGVGFAATGDDGGITLFGAASLVRLTPSRSVAWQQSYEPFRDAFDEQLAQTSDGGYVAAAGIALDRMRVARMDESGHLQWSHEYTVVEDGAAILNDIVERSPGEYLIVGAKRDGQQGWALALSETLTPTVTPEPTPTPTATETTTRTSPTTGTSTTEPATSQPGFGIGAALVGLGAGLLARRR